VGLVVRIVMRAFLVRIGDKVKGIEIYERRGLSTSRDTAVCIISEDTGIVRYGIRHWEVTGRGSLSWREGPFR
jgi:hypothetical protein